jgi:hypothetical protein
MVAGTWVDDINHGFCRLTGGTVRIVWHAPLWQRCEEISQQLLRVGFGLTLLAVAVCTALFVLYLRTGQRGSLVVPLSVAVTALLLAVFGAQYPFDHHPVVKASYALHLGAPLCACVGLALVPGGGWAHLASTPLRRWLFCRLPKAGLGAAIAAVAWLVALELWTS